MPIVTAAQVELYTDISATAGTIITSELIPMVQDRIRRYCFNAFVSENIYLQHQMDFTATGGFITAPSSFETAGFAQSDEIYLYGSYRNDGYYTILSVSTVTITVATTESVVAELSGASILVSLVNWPISIPYVAAQMVKYDYDDRPARSGGLASQSLGPRSESYSDVGGMPYPNDLASMLDQYRVARLM